MQIKTELNRISISDKDGKLLAEVTFPNIDDNTVLIDHTFVDESLRGQGVAAKLMEAVAEELIKNKKKVKLSCSYAISWFAKHPEYNDILA